MAHAEFRAGRYPVAAAIARLIRQRAPNEPEPQRLLALLAQWHWVDEAPEHYDEAVAAFIDTPFSAIRDDMDTALNVVPNEWSVVEARLKARGIL